MELAVPRGISGGNVMSRRSRKTYPAQLLGGERQTLGGGPTILGRPKAAEPADSAALEPIVEALLELLLHWKLDL